MLLDPEFYFQNPARPCSGTIQKSLHRKAVMTSQTPPSIDLHDRRLAPVMFSAAFSFLACLAGALHLHERAEYETVWLACNLGMGLLYPIFVAESLWHIAVRGTIHWKTHLIHCLLPPLRLAARDTATRSWIWMPHSGWLNVNDELRERIERSFTIPMIAIALLMLPMLAAEYFWSAAIANDLRLAATVDVLTLLIWMAFTFEFVVMISVVERKFDYCRAHWIDLAVICLPLVAFLRAGRLGRLLRLQQLSRTARVYRLRGLATRAWRGLLLLNLVDRVMRTRPELHLRRLRRQLEVKEEEVRQLSATIAELESRLEQQAEQQGVLKIPPKKNKQPKKRRRAA